MYSYYSNKGRHCTLFSLILELSSLNRGKISHKPFLCMKRFTVNMQPLKKSLVMLLDRASTQENNTQQYHQ